MQRQAQALVAVAAAALLQQCIEAQGAEGLDAIAACEEQKLLGDALNGPQVGAHGGQIALPLFVAAAAGLPVFRFHGFAGQAQPHPQTSNRAVQIVGDAGQHRVEACGQLAHLARTAQRHHRLALAGAHPGDGGAQVLERTLHLQQQEQPPCQHAAAEHRQGDDQGIWAEQTLGRQR